MNHQLSPLSKVKQTHDHSGSDSMGRYFVTVIFLRVESMSVLFFFGPKNRHRIWKAVKGVLLRLCGTGELGEHGAGRWWYG